MASPAWSIHSVAIPTHFTPGDASGFEGYTVYVTNVGSQPTNGEPVTITDTLPAGVRLEGTETGGGILTGPTRNYESSVHPECTEEAPSVVQCTYSEAVPAGDILGMTISASIEQSAPVSRNTVSVTGGGAAPASASAEDEISTTPAPFAINDFSFEATGLDGAGDVQAGAHPYAVTTTLDFNNELIPGEPEVYEAAENPKDVVVDLPLGLVGNPQTAPKCPLDKLEIIPGSGNAYECPANTMIGEVTVRSSLGKGIASSVAGEGSVNAVSPLYNLVPEYGHAAEFGFDVSSVVRAHLYASVVHTNAGYMLRITTPDITAEFLRVGERGFLAGVTLTLFGDPGSQDGGGSPPAPFFTNPVDCSASGLAATVHVDTWARKGRVNPDGTPDFSDPNWLSEPSSLPQVTGCSALQFNPTLRVQPDSTQADSPTGVTVDLKVPQAPSHDGVLATPPLKDATVTLPQGLVLSPSTANGLQACSEAELGFEDGEVNNSQPKCPEASKVATVELTTPLLANPIGGSVYLAEQGNNPFGSLVALYIVVDDPTTGVLLKLPGEVSLNPVTGQVTATFDNNPQLPFSDLTLRFKEGARAPLVTPAACGTYETTSSLTPWSAPESGPPATPSDSFQVSSGCASGFAPSFTSGTTSNQAGAYSPFTLTFSHQDDEQDFRGLEATLPPGLLARLAGVPLCGEAEAKAGSCPAGSRIGTVTVAAGAGPDPVYVHGEIFLTGAYNGGPFGEVVEVPAVAGPFNLGMVVVRGSIRINPSTAQASVISDPFPTILQGIPLQIKTVNVTLDREGFTFNPTNCNPLAITGTITSTQGTHAAVSSRFQAANCANLPFKPSFSASTAGKASKPSGASLDVKITSGAGQANIGKVKVDLPKQLPSRLTTLQKACLASVFEANPAGCPKESDVGTATAVTPVLAHPLAGPAYLVSHGGAAFPDLEIVLQGEGIVLILDGTTQIKKGITSSTFNTVPDAPISSFELKLPTGKYSILAAYLPNKANYNFCGQTLAMPTAITGQNGAVVKQTTKVAVSGCPKAKKPKKKAKKKAKKASRARNSSQGKGRKA